MTHMRHNHTDQCWNNNICSKNFPKDYIRYTQRAEDGYPFYRRRAPQQGGIEVILKKCDKTKIITNAGLLLKYNCHINLMLGIFLAYMRVLRLR